MTKKALPIAGRPSDAEIKEVMRIFREQEQSRRDFVDQYGQMRRPQLVNAGDKACVLVGSEIYRQIHDGPYGFMNAIHGYALHVFGNDYLERQEAKPFNERHPAIQWMHSYVELRDSQIKAGIPETEVDRTGAGAAWFRFAYDLFTIKDNARLEEKLRERLLDGNFQAARHELRVAAFAVTAGFRIDFEDEADNSSKHPEFIGTDLRNGYKIAVEAKSRHRRNVMGFSSGLDIEPGSKVNIRGMVTEAYKQTDLPLYVFVDVNLPPAKNEEQFLQWQTEIVNTMKDLATEGYATPCPANAVFFTNDPSHYLGDLSIGTPETNLWLQHFEAHQPRIQHPAEDIVPRFIRAWEQRVAPPDSIPD